MQRWQVVARSWARRIGIDRPLRRLLSRRRQTERDNERAAVFESVRPGDLVWDVGANCGGYSIQLAKAIGDAGTVWAFEPAPDACEIMTRRLAEEGISNVEVVCTALGDRTANVTMELASVPGGFLLDPPTGPGTATHNPVGKNPTTVEVLMTSGDAYRADNGLPVPQFLKIDVEGFEVEVLKGLHETLRNQQCRAVMCEVHFARLEARGSLYGPMAVQTLLRDAGFSTKWVGASHVFGTK